MNLQTARGLRAELRTFLDSEPLRARTAGIGLGIGVTSQPDDYVIAVRAPSDEALPADVLQMLRVRTAGEIDVRITGQIRVELPAEVPTFGATAGMAMPADLVRRRPRVVFGSGTRGVSTAAARLRIGTSIGHYRITAGTLGFFARRNSDGAVGLVSNNHVIAAADQGVEGDDILHPAHQDHGRPPKDVVALLSGTYPRLWDARGVDCAFARLQPHVTYDATALAMGRKLTTTAPPEGQRAVSKVGRTTKLTYGRIRTIEIDRLDIYYGLRPVRYTDQIEIESSSDAPFAQKGDSGSLIVNPDGHALGLLFAGMAVGGVWGSGLSYAHPIDDVLRALDVSLLV